MDPACLLMYMGLLIHMAYGHLYILKQFPKWVFVLKNKLILYDIILY